MTSYAALIGDKSSKQRRSPFTAIAVLVFVFAFWFVYMESLHPDVAFMDTLRFLSYFEASDRGQRSIWSTWNQGQHRGLLPQAFVYLNAKYFNFNIYYATLSAGLFLALTYFLVVLNVYRATAVHGGKVERFYFGAGTLLTVVALFSLSNWELYSLDVGSALFLKNLIFIIFWFFLSKLLMGEASSVTACLVLVSGPLIVMFVAFGWAFPFVGASLISVVVLTGYKDITRDRVIAYLLLLLILSLIAYVAAGATGALMGAPRNFDQKNASLLNFLYSIFFAFGSIFVGHETSSSYSSLVVLQIFGVICCIAAILLVFRHLGQSRPGKISFLPMAMLLYGLIDLVLVAFARGRFEPTSAMASRYFSDFCFIPIGLVWLTYLRWVGELNAGLSPVNRAVGTQLRWVAGMAICFFLGQVLTSVHEWKKAPYRNAAFNEMKQATLRAARGARDISILQAPIDVAIEGARVQRDYGFGVFSGLRCAFEPSDDGWLSETRVLSLRNCGGDLRFDFYLPDRFPEKNVVVTVDGIARNILLRPGEASRLSVPAGGQQVYEISIAVDKMTKVSDVDPTSSDNRSLGVIFSSASTQKLFK